MSTTFEVIPVDNCDVTFSQLLNLAEKRINTFLKEYAILTPITLKASIHDNKEKYVTKIGVNSVFTCNENEYIWIQVDGIAGGTDIHCEEIREDYFVPDNPWWRFDEMKANNKTIEEFEAKIEKSKKINKYWRSRRSAGQPAIINLSYGMISAALAELTGGFIWTDDGAWNYNKFPAEPTEFYKWYFQPDKEEDSGSADWAKECIDHMADEITVANKN